MNTRASLSLLSALVMGIAGRAKAQGSPCLANPDTAAAYTQAVTRIVTLGDSSRLVQQGIPFNPQSGVGIVTDSLTCRAIINAYNGLSAPDSTDIGHAYVMTVGTTAYAMVGEKAPGVVIFFDSSYHWLAGFAKM